MRPPFPPRPAAARSEWFPGRRDPAPKHIPNTGSKSQDNFIHFHRIEKCRRALQCKMLGDRSPQSVIGTYQGVPLLTRITERDDHLASGACKSSKLGC